MNLLRVNVLFALALLAVRLRAHATESVDCIGEQYSAQIVCGSKGCMGVNLYLGSELQGGTTWRIKEGAELDHAKNHIDLTATNIAFSPSQLRLSVRAENGLLFFKGQHAVQCSWPAG